MHIVAIAATDGAFVDLVMEGHIERGLDVVVALEAESGLRGLEQVLGFGVVNLVAADAAYVGLGVGRAQKVGMGAAMATEALRVQFFGAGLGGIEDLGGVAAAVDVSLARAVTAFAVDTGCTVLRSQLGVGVIGELLRDFFMAGGAGFAADEV